MQGYYAANRMVHIDTSKWSGEGELTQILIDHLRQIDRVAFLRVEDAPASRAESDYNFISNEVYVAFATSVEKTRIGRFAILRGMRKVSVKSMTLADLESSLTAAAGIGAPDYSDEHMLQYLRTARIVPPYQTRGYKMVEMVRVYEIVLGP
jgi:hypothetical protein